MSPKKLLIGTKLLRAGRIAALVISPAFEFVKELGILVLSSLTVRGDEPNQHQNWRFDEIQKEVVQGKNLLVTEILSNNNFANFTQHGSYYLRQAIDCYPKLLLSS